MPKLTKKRNPPDATNRNVRASSNRDEKLRLKLKSLDYRIKELTKRVKSLEKANDYFNRQLEKLKGKR